MIEHASSWLEPQRSARGPSFRIEFARYDSVLGLLRSLGLPHGVAGRERARQILYIWLRSIVAGDHLGADRFDMASAVETRLPYLDHHLFETVPCLPVASLAVLQNRHRPARVTVGTVNCDPPPADQEPSG